MITTLAEKIHDGRFLRWRTSVFSNSLGLVMAGLFLLSWLAQSIAGVVAYNADQLANRQDPLSWLGIRRQRRLLEPHPAELAIGFLAIGSMVVFSIYLRQRGSPESKRSAPPTSPPVNPVVDGVRRSGLCLR